jgi:ABC-type sugar transport system ATPase subunit/ABC-type sugar transport system substrate-binding protein
LDATCVFECSGISKAFGGTKALDEVELAVKKGEVHALMGENGAGKSTLMKIIMGLYKADKGQMLLEGKPYVSDSPAEAIRAGISMIHQELNPEPYLTIAENIFLNREDTFGRTPFLNKKETNRKAADILAQFKFNADPKMLMENLTLAQVQMIEIIKSVSCDAKLIIMDEPTSALDSEETDRLFETIRSLKEKGVSIIYISHRMDEIMDICDTVSVLRDGKYIGTKAIGDTTKNELITMMVGREISSIFPKTDCPIKEVVFEVKGLSGKGFQDISFEVRKGEILGVLGLVGSGRSETMRAVFGLDPLTCGEVYLQGKRLKIKSPSDAIDCGIAMVNEDRKNYGLCLFRSIRENISLPTLIYHQKQPILRVKREKRECSDIAKRLRIKAPSIEADVFSLSGGNQQKVVMSVVACGGGATDDAGSPSGTQDKIVVGWLQKNTTNVFETKINAGGLEKLEEMKANGVIDDYICLDGNTDPSTQISQANDLVNYGVTVAIVQPAESDGSAPAVQILHEAGIPVVVVNAKTNNTEELAAAYVGSDDVNAGEIMGRYILDTCGDTGGYGHLMGMPGNSAAIERTEGIHNIMDQASGWKMLDEQTAEWAGDKASKFTQDWISLYGAELTAIICDNDDMSVASKLACIEAGREDIVVIGVDAIDSALQMVSTGELNATVFQDGEGQGRLAAETCEKLIKGEPIEKEYWIDFVLITQDNIGDYYKG